MIKFKLKDVFSKGMLLLDEVASCFYRDLLFSLIKVEFNDILEIMATEVY